MRRGLAAAAAGTDGPPSLAQVLGGVRPYFVDERAGVAVVCGDCREVLARLPAGCADAVVTDPPYNVGKRYGTYDDDRPEAEYLAWLREVFAACARALRADGSLLWTWPGLRVARGEVTTVLPEGWAVHHLAAWHRTEFAGDRWAASTRRTRGSRSCGRRGQGRRFGTTARGADTRAAT